MSSPSKPAASSSSSTFHPTAAIPDHPKKPLHSSSTSSIGKNSSEDDDDATTTAAAGSDQGDQVSINVNALEDALPTKKGLSEHHSGKLKSYGNLADAEEDSSIAKPEDSYSKKRKNKLAKELYIGGLGREPFNKKLTTESGTAAPPPSTTNAESGTDSQEANDPDSSSSDL